jgi:O-antigen/teichoic acid export membrane protein
MPKKTTTRGEVLLLTFANGVESALRLLVPVALVRLMDPGEFGQYRLFWLIANTLLLLVPLGIGRSLLFFLPRSTPKEQGAIVSQSLFYFTAVSLPIAVCFAMAPGWLPVKITSLTEPPLVLGAFIFVWLVSSLLNVLPNADRNIRWQAGAIIITAVVRTLIVLAVAWKTQDLQAVFVALLAFSSLQCVLLGYYVLTRHGANLSWPRMSGLLRQFSYSFPFGLSGILARARRQIEQWIVVALYASSSLAVFSIAVSFNELLSLLRSSVGNIVLPKMSERHASGDLKRALELNNRGNLSICFLIYPFIVFLWAYADPLIRFVYTAEYVEAVPILRIYAVNMFFTSVELATVLLIYEQGRFVATVSAGVLVFAALLSYGGALAFGLPGVAIGGLIGTMATRYLNFHRAAKMLGVRFSELQDWGTLRRMLFAGLAAGIFARLATDAVEWLAGSEILTLLAGCVLISGAYLLLSAVLRFHWVPLSMLGRQQWPATTASFE